MTDENGYFYSYDDCAAVCNDKNHKCEPVELDVRVYYDCVYRSRAWLWCTIAVIALVIIVGIVAVVVHRVYSVQ